MIDDNKVDFAEVCKDILVNPIRGQKVAPNESHSQKEASDKTISQRHYEVCKEGVAKNGSGWF